MIGDASYCSLLAYIFILKMLPAFLLEYDNLCMLSDTIKQAESMYRGILGHFDHQPHQGRNRMSGKSLGRTGNKGIMSLNIPVPDGGRLNGQPPVYICEAKLEGR